MLRNYVFYSVALFVSVTAFSCQSTSAQDDRKPDPYTRYAEGLFKRYDEDKDGLLDQAEIDSMRRPPIGADQNGDNVLSKQELIDDLSKKSKQSNRNSNSRSRSPSASSGATDNPKPAFIAVSLELFEIQNDVDTTPFAEFVYNLPGIGDNLDQEIKKIKDCPGIQRVASCNCVTGINGGNFWDSSNRDFGFRNELQFRVVRVTPNVELELSWNFERKTGSKKQKVVADRKTKSAKQIAITSELEELIKQKIEEKKQELARKKANESAQGHKRPKTLSLGTQLVCGDHGASAIFVNEDHCKWLVIVKTETP